jgi:beta-mannosidase
MGNTWLMQDMIEDYFGKSASLEELVDHGQLLQCEGYKAIYEEARRQKPYCSMALNWCYNEPWPTAANNSIINWPNVPKPGYYAVRDACRPVLASARNTKLEWKEGEKFSTQVWMLNDRDEILEAGVVRMMLAACDTVMELTRWEFGPANSNTNIEGPEVSGVLPSWNTNRFQLKLEVEGYPEYNSTYTFIYNAK